jgi:hypothetical protein
VSTFCASVPVIHSPQVICWQNKTGIIAIISMTAAHRPQPLCLHRLPRRLLRMRGFGEVGWVSVTVMTARP